MRFHKFFSKNKLTTKLKIVFSISCQDHKIMTQLNCSHPLHLCMNFFEKTVLNNNTHKFLELNYNFITYILYNNE